MQRSLFIRVLSKVNLTRFSEHSALQNNPLLIGEGRFCVAKSGEVPLIKNFAKRSIVVCVALLMLCSCEVYKIGSVQTVQSLPDIDQRSAQGVVYLFKNEIDSNNIVAAVRVFASEQDRQLLAIEKYEMKFDVERWGRSIAHKEITALRADTISSTRQSIKAEFNYSKALTFTTVRLGDKWFITSVKE
jgi:hypothetical protein